MNFSHKFFYVLTASAAAFLAAACAGTGDKNTETQKSPAAPASANAPVPVSAKAALTFAQADAARAKNRVPAVKPSEAQQKIDSDFNRKFFPLRDAYRRKGGDAEIYELEKLLKEPNVSPAVLAQIPLCIVEAAGGKRNYNHVVDTATRALTGPYKFPSSARGALLFARAGALEQRKDYAGAADDLLARLAEDVPDNDLFQQQRRIILLYNRAGQPAVADALAAELLASGTLTPENRTRVWNDRIDFVSDGKNPAKMLELANAVRKSGKDPLQVALMRRLMALMDRMKMTAELNGLRESMIGDPSVPVALRLDVFYAKATPIKNNEWSNKRRIFYLLGNTIFRNYRKNPFYGKPLIANAGAEVSARQQEDLRWIADAIKESGMTPDQAVHLVEYLKVIVKWDIKDPQLLRALSETVMTYPDMPDTAKVGSYSDAITFALDEEDFAKAEKLADEVEKLNLVPGTQSYVNAHSLKAHILRIQDRCDDAVALIRAKMKADKELKKTSGMWFNKIIEIYSAFGRTDDVIKTQLERGDRQAAMNTMASRYPDRAREWADKVIADEKEDWRFRNSCMAKFYSGGSDKARAMRAKYPELVKFSVHHWIGRARTAITFADYRQLAEAIDAWKRTDPKPSWERVEMELQMYSALGDRLKLHELKKYVMETDVFKPDQKLLVSFCAGAMWLEDKPGEFGKYYRKFPFEAGVTNAQRAKILLQTGILAMNACRYAIADESHKTWEALFKPEPKKCYTLEFSDTPILGYAGFMQHAAGKAEKHLLDRKFGGNMDFLVTDVSTGSRSAAIGKDKKEVYRPTVMQAACDENGIHFLFTAFDEKTREIEAGTAGAGSYEMYLAPGDNQPYFCFLPDLTSGVSGVWDSTYNNPQFRRIDAGKKKQQLRMERTFTEKGYVLYMFLSWEPFYDKLPDPGDLWDFENVHWSRFGGYSWNGLKTIHGRSTWGHLRFRISPDQMLKIKRKLIYSAKRAYQAEKSTNAAIHGVIDRWKNDKVLGDPVFYKKSVEPLVLKLDTGLGRVKADMTPETINELYRDFVPGWNEIRYRIGELRTRYIEKSLTD